ncbi:MAG: hypothetical protein H7146_05925 [Burkholderiaceae bacterium]|nr:hypothetical protein [Microbacteriaceae bacterium]
MLQGSGDSSGADQRAEGRGATILLTTHYLGRIDEIGGVEARVLLVRWSDANGDHGERTSAPGGGGSGHRPARQTRRGRPSATALDCVSATPTTEELPWP